MSHIGWNRRSSSLRIGGRPSHQDNVKQPGSHHSRNLEPNSRIPVRSSSQSSAPGQDMPHMVRSRSNLGMPHVASTPRPNAVANFTPINNISMTPLFSASSNKKFQVPHKDARNLNDKDFQREATNMVLVYFQDNQPTILKNSNIRPMEIKMFIDMVNHLFERLGIYHKDTLVQFSRNNYEKELPVWMKHLEYPASVTKGWLQTVNVPNYWPQVLGLLSWLVSLLIASDAYDAELQISESAEGDVNQHNIVQYFKACLHAHNVRGSGEAYSFSEICRQQLKMEEEALGITDKEIEKLELENRQLFAQVNDPQWQAEKDAIDELEQRLTVAESQAGKATEEMERKKDAIEAVKTEAAKRERNIVTLKMEAEKCRLEMVALKGKIDKQAMSIGEFAELKKKCDYALKEIEYMEKEAEDIEKMVAKYEREIAAKRDKILHNSHAFNTNIIQLEQQVPELTGLRVRVNLESSQAVEDLEKQVDKLKEIKTRLVADCQELETRRLERVHVFDRLMGQLQEAVEVEQKIRDATARTKAQIEEIQSTGIEEEKTLKLKVDELEKKTSAFQLKEKEKENLNEEVQTLKKRSELLDKFLIATDKKIEEKWAENAEKLKIIYAEIVSTAEQLAQQDAFVEKRINELILKYRRNEA